MSQPADSRFETGLDILVPAGQPVSAISQVVVTGPGLPGFVSDTNRGVGVLLKPMAGCSFLTLSRQDGAMSSCSSFFRLSSQRFSGDAYNAPATDARYRQPMMADAQIQNAIGAGSLYKFEVKPLSGSVATYWNRLNARPMTMAEMPAVPWISLTSATRAQLVDGFPKNAPSRVQLSWVRPGTAAAAHTLQVFHSAGNNLMRVPLTVTSGVVPCVGNSLCEGATDLYGYRNFNVDTLNVPGKTMYQITSTNRFGIIKYAQFMQ